MTQPEPKRRRGGALGRLGGVLLLIGVLVGVAAVPTGTLVLAGTKWADKQKDELPTQLLTPASAQVTRVYANDGKTLITTFYDEDRHDVALGQISTVASTSRASPGRWSTTPGPAPPSRAPPR
jgi:membrane peptidoglycan carboxypeptidase